MKSPDWSDICALTPGHFLNGCPITNIPNSDISNVPLNQLKYWEFVLKRTQTFWKRWSREYLNTLNQHTKWMKVKDNLKINDIVLVKDENSPSSLWPLEMIADIHTGNNRLVRVVTVTMRIGTYKDLLSSKATSV